MAILRNREVHIIQPAPEINDSTFMVKNVQDGQTEYASLSELEFTEDEYDNYVKPTKTPSVRIIPSVKTEAKPVAKAK